MACPMSGVYGTPVQTASTSSLQTKDRYEIQSWGKRANPEFHLCCHASEEGCDNTSIYATKDVTSQFMLLKMQHLDYAAKYEEF